MLCHRRSRQDETNLFFATPRDEDLFAFAVAARASKKKKGTLLSVSMCVEPSASTASLAAEIHSPTRNPISNRIRYAATLDTIAARTVNLAAQLRLRSSSGSRPSALKSQPRLFTQALMPSAADVAKRELVKVLRELASKYKVNLTLTRDSPKKDVERAFRAVAGKAHPDKGGRLEDFQKLSATNDTWCGLLKNAAAPGRPPKAATKPRPTAGKSWVLGVPVDEKVFSVRSQAVLLTYQSFPADSASFLPTWRRFVSFVASKQKTWGIKFVKSGLLGGLLRKLNPSITDRPWRVLSDGEKFLHFEASQSAYNLRHVSLWAIPPRSPDLDPIENFWSWLRTELRRRDLEDYTAKRPCPTKPQYIARVKQVLQTAKAKRVAGNIAAGFKKACQEVARRRVQQHARDAAWRDSGCCA